MASVSMVEAGWRRLVDGFWFVPGAVALAYALLSFVLVRIDRSVGPNGAGVGFGGDADAARGILSTIAGSLVTVAGLAFSLTIVVLTLVSSQFSPRALPRLLADRVNQVVAGSFVGIFAYCLLTLRTVRAETDTADGFVPALAVSASIVLALLALGLLLLFIHHTGRSIQASQITARMGRETLQAIDRLYPAKHGLALEESGDELVREWSDQGAPGLVFPERPGYVHVVPVEELLGVLSRPGLRAHVSIRPGDFVTEATALMAVWPPEALDEGTVKPLRQAIPIESDRDLRHDAGYGIRQLADVALKALSPGINDPTTADTCIGYLRAVLERLAERAVPAEVCRFPDRQAVVVVRRVSFGEHVDCAYSEIGRNASDNARVVSAVLEALASIARCAGRAHAQERTHVLGEIARAVAGPALERAGTARDRASIQAGLDRVELVVRDS